MNSENLEGRQAIFQGKKHLAGQQLKLAFTHFQPNAAVWQSYTVRYEMHKLVLNYYLT